MKAEELVELVGKMKAGDWEAKQLLGSDYWGCFWPDRSKPGVHMRRVDNGSVSLHDAAGIVALRNHAVPIIAALLAERDALRQQLSTYGRHRNDAGMMCSLLRDQILGCDCGWGRARAALSTDSGEKG